MGGAGADAALVLFERGADVVARCGDRDLVAGHRSRGVGAVAVDAANGEHAGVGGGVAEGAVAGQVTDAGDDDDVLARCVLGGLLRLYSAGVVDRDR